MCHILTFVYVDHTAVVTGVVAPDCAAEGDAVSIVAGMSKQMIIGKGLTPGEGKIKLATDPNGHVTTFTATIWAEPAHEMPSLEAFSLSSPLPPLEAYFRNQDITQLERNDVIPRSTI